jgi:hypothetical protein
VILAAAGAALAAACCYAVAATVMHRAVGREPVAHTLDPRLLGRLVRRRMWLGGVGADIAGTGLHGTALALGPLALVQPLLVTGLVVAVPLEAATNRRRPSRREFGGVIAAGAGLATFVVVADPRPGPVPPADADLITVAVGAGAVMAALLLVASHTSGEVRATALGVATGAGFALAAALAKACLDRLARDGFGAVLVDWRLPALAAVGLAAVVLNQNAYQAGGLAGPLTGIVLTDPLGSVAIAVVAYGEQVRTSPAAIAVEVLALAAMAVGVWLVSHAGVYVPRGPAHRLFSRR